MYTIILLTPDNNHEIVGNIANDYIHCFIGIGESQMFIPLGSFQPEMIGGNPYRYMEEIKLLAMPNFDTDLEDSTIIVYSLASGSERKHNGLPIGPRLNRLHA